MADPPPPIRVNRAPVLTLWATVVAERLGHPPDTALSLASVVAGTAARAHAHRPGIVEQRDHGKDASLRLARLLGKDIRLTHDADGVVLADAGDGKPAASAPVAAYLAKAFGGRLDEVRAAMANLAAGIEPQELNRVGFRLYERFRSDVPQDMKGWGAKSTLDLARIRSAAE